MNPHLRKVYNAVNEILYDAWQKPSSSHLLKGSNAHVEHLWY